jgi:hypothetical protein
MSDVTSNTLDYDRGRAPKPMITLHYIARACGVGPMAVGVLAFGLFLVTRHADFAVLGFFTILGGCAAAFVGAVCLAVYWYQARRANAEDAATARRHAKRDAVIILLNFPLAGLLAFIGLSMLHPFE